MTKLINKDVERLNPCLKEQEQSYKCLNKNGFDQSKCEAYFDNYNTCKMFWDGKPKRANSGVATSRGKVYRDRKAKGVYPYLPDVEERAKIKADYIKAVKDN